MTPIAKLHWSDAHVPQIDLATVNRFKAIGAGIAVHPFRYLSADATDGNAGPPLRMILDSGVHVGAGSDSAQISTLNPWNMIYYMVTGINAGGHLVNAGQTVTRAEALRLYTASNGWFFREEDKIGSIENGKGHPRGAGTFARVLGRYVREEKALGLMDAVRKMTLMPAQRLGIQSKGRLQVGSDADITVFDPARVIDRATFDNPAQYSDGIPFVLVGGSFVVRNGELVAGVSPGHAVRR